MSIMTDARLRLLEARVAEIERRLADRNEPLAEAGTGSTASPKPRAKRKGAHKPRKRSRKAT